jgi:lipoate-protein ligase A
MSYPRRNWRLIYHPPAHGSWNMAVDESILESASAGKVLPTLRLYAWNPTCISLGYAQAFSDVDIPRLQTRGWEMIRRPTGGRAILHCDELTYAIAAPISEPCLTGNLLESYQRISKALLLALIMLNIPAERSEKPLIKSHSVDQNPVCFERPSNYEITYHEKKIIGSAQARRRDGVLQHGSLPLFGDLSRITQVLAYPNELSRTEAGVRLLTRATTLEAILGHPISWDEAAQAFMAAFQQCLNLDFEIGELTPAEQTRAVELVKNKYTLPSWSERVI